MPLLEKSRRRESPPISAPKNVLPDWRGGEQGKFDSMFPVCANPGCRSGWLHLWRSRQKPVFEGGWTCSTECLKERIATAVTREMAGQETAPIPHRHRVPLGLVMLSQGWINRVQLSHALESQRSAGSGRLGEWLIRDYGLDEQLVTKALSLQWNCPVYTLDRHQPQVAAALVPRLLIDACGILPIRVAAARIFYVGFEDRLDACVTLALERMTGLRVEAGLLPASIFHRAQEILLASAFPSARLIEASGQDAATSALTLCIEKAKPSDARLVRMHDCLWLRMWREGRAQPPAGRDAVEDVLCTVGNSNLR
jgi:hypothetical protein